MIKCLFICKVNDDLDLYKRGDTYYVEDYKILPNDKKMNGLVVGYGNVFEIDKVREKINLHTLERRYEIDGLTSSQLADLGCTTSNNISKMYKKGDLWAYKFGYHPFEEAIELRDCNLYTNKRKTRQLRNIPKDWVYAYGEENEKIVVKTVSPLEMYFIIRKMKIIIFSNRKFDIE